MRSGNLVAEGTAPSARSVGGLVQIAEQSAGDDSGSSRVARLLDFRARTRVAPSRSAVDLRGCAARGALKSPQCWGRAVAAPLATIQGHVRISQACLRCAVRHRARGYGNRQG